jgi:hypothetical protein
MTSIPVNQKLVNTASTTETIVQGIQQNQRTKHAKDKRRSQDIPPHAVRMDPQLERTPDAPETLLVVRAKPSLPKVYARRKQSKLQDEARDGSPLPTHEIELDQGQPRLAKVKCENAHR